MSAYTKLAHFAAARAVILSMSMSGKRRGGGGGQKWVITFLPLSMKLRSSPR